ncbi:MAG TPA: hypothetical protein VGD78_10235 [Chthoniobacterales bacterium]
MVTWLLIILIVGMVPAVVVLSGTPVRLRWLVTGLGVLCLIVYLLTALW